MKLGRLIAFMKLYKMCNFKNQLLLSDVIMTRVIALYVEHVRPLLNPQNDYLLPMRNGTQYKKLGNAMCKLVYQAIGKYIHPTIYRQIIETESAKRLSLED